MNSFKKPLLLFVATCFLFAPVLCAQDVPPVPRIASNEPVGQDQDATDLDSKQEEGKPAQKANPSNNEKTDANQSKADEDSEQDGESKKSDEGKSSSDKKADDQTPGDKQAEDKKAEDKKAEDKKADKKQAGGEPGKAKRSIAQRALDRMRGVRGASLDERVNKFSKQSDGFVKMFEPVVASVNASTLTVMNGKRPIALGTVVDSNGLVLTKYSELRGSLGCKLNDGTILEAMVIGVDPKSDLALLKIDAENLNVAQWSEDPPPVTGRWLATPKASSGNKPTIGVVSVNTRKIPRSRPFIGVLMAHVEETGRVRISRIVAGSPAEDSELHVNDFIVSIDGTEINDILSVQAVLGQYDINDRITIGILRGDKKMNIRLTLGEKDKVAPEYQRSNLQNSMGSILSRRRKDFPNAFQHDSMLSSKTCGGPIVDLSGKIVGINIARAGRVSSLALPAFEVREIVELLKTGDFAPAVVHKKAIEKISVELEEISTKYGHLPGKKEVLERKYNVEKARMDELNKSIEELKKRLSVIDAKRDNYKSELDSVREKMTNIEKNRQRLESDRERLRTGSR